MTFKIKFLISATLLMQINALTQSLSSYFRITKFAMISDNNQTNSSLIETISAISVDSDFKLECLFACNLNQDCDLFVLDLNQAKCKLYKKTNTVCASRTTDSSVLIYDKFLKDLWICCGETPNYIVNTFDGLCYYFQEGLSLAWSQAYNFCNNLSLSLLIVNSQEKLQFFQALTLRLSQNIWVDSSTTVPLVYKWLDGSSINSSYWTPGEPNNWGGNSTYIGEGCVMLYQGGLLNDGECGWSLPFVCQ